MLTCRERQNEELDNLAGEIRLSLPFEKASTRFKTGVYPLVSQSVWQYIHHHNFEPNPDKILSPRIVVTSILDTIYHQPKSTLNYN